MTRYTEYFATHPNDFKNYCTEKIRTQFLLTDLFVPGEINMAYSHYDRFIAGAAIPLNKSITLESIDPLKAKYFLERRELGIINIGGNGNIITDGLTYSMKHKEALYLGKETQTVRFESNDPMLPARFYFNSAPAHCKYPNVHITFNKAEVLEAGAIETSNYRRINKLIVNSLVKTCQLQMGLTELQPGSVWNTMPPHVHSRRMEVYLYFNIPPSQAVCHYMGQPHETRHIWMHNEQAVISPDWSIHAAAGTSNYSFIWGMAGENLDYTDMDTFQPNELK